MNIPALNDFFRKRARARLRHLMRGYRSLRKTGGLRRIAAVKEALTTTPVFFLRGDLQIFTGLNGKASEIAVRQFLLVRFVDNGLSAALLSSLGRRNAPVVFPLPRAWRKIVCEHDFEVAERSSSFLWAFVVAVYFASGIFVALKLALVDARYLLRPGKMKLNRHVYFDALGPGNLPPVVGGGGGNDIVSWYLHWPGRVPNLDAVCHNVVAAGMSESYGTAVVPIASPLLPLTGLLSLSRFLAVSSYSIVKAFFNTVRGHWWYSLMLGESTKAAHISVQDSAILARDYLFHNSNWTYRPLWTYEAERQGARILFYFYSTNIEQFKQFGVYPEPLFGWQTMTWSKYLVWDDYQKSFVRRAVGDAAEISVVKFISFHSGVPAPSSLPPRSIAVFDVQPMRDAVYQPLALDLEYYVPRNANKFLTDIQEVTAMADRVMLFKRKRDVGTRVHPSYEQTVKALSACSNYLEIDPHTSASALIEKCQAVISVPFTSTALIGRDLGKPSIYYDPHGQCEKDDRAAHGIPIVSGRVELLDWLAALESQPGKPGLKP